MINFALPIYDEYRKWIRKARENSKTWEEIDYACCANEDELMIFLQKQKVLNWWDIDSNDWKELVHLQKEAEERTKRIVDAGDNAILVNENQDSATYVPSDEKSSWQLYKNHLLKQGFQESAITSIEHTTIRVLKRLNRDTSHFEPVKGLVIGNVQSGKTANMAALMSMAADWGWNMFIVLSGTIDSLRKQTQSRLLNDLNQPGNITWRGLEHLSKKTSLEQRTQYLHFEENVPDRYFTVCLKNPGRLRNLIGWLQSDINKQKQMRILVIDDEADQAGINTADISTSIRKTINKLIVNLVNGNDAKGNIISGHYNAMNYIGYTATPYANILNESSTESLYPKNFIATLKNSNMYFGPQQIFGVEGDDFDGLDIIRVIDQDDTNNEDEELFKIKQIHEGYVYELAEGLKDAICWFLCCTATMRVWGYSKPISMLIHTSQKQDHHEYVSQAVLNWLSSFPMENIIERCEDIWKTETERFTIDSFKSQYRDYGIGYTEINQYPNFNNLISEVRILVSKISNIKLSEENELSYHEGIHLCIDNCKYNKIDEDGNYVRLAYPDSNNMPSIAPAFIVIGGATLSRGLTIEGLVSTFFLRSVSQADTLMQMGRWFGYRKGYELLPRIWMTSKTLKQFVFLSTLDLELREQIYYMETMGLDPSKYGPKVKNTPTYNFIRITAKNKMQCAEETDMDYSGTINQTILFDNKEDILLSNIKLAEDFVNSLGQPIVHAEEDKHSIDSLIWEDITFEIVYNRFLKQFKFQERSRVFNNISSVADWIKKMTDDGKLENWNVVVSGKGKANHSSNNWILNAGSVNKINRTQRKKSAIEGLIDIGVLRSPIDLIKDVKLSDIDLDNDTKNKIKQFKPIFAKEIREKAGLSITPQLIIYRINKDSKSDENNKLRQNLEAVQDLIGICINVPGGKRGTNYSTAVYIKLENDEVIMNNDVDLEGTE